MSDILPGSMYSRGGRDHFSESVMKSIRSVERPPKALQVLNFQGCTINKPTTQKFLLKNISGIRTSFNFKSINFAPISTKIPAAILGRSSLEDIVQERKETDTVTSSSKLNSKSSKRTGGLKAIRFAG